MVSFVCHVTLSKVQWFTSDREKKYEFSVFVIVRHHFGILRFLSSSLLEGTAATKMAATRFCRFIVPSTSVKVTTKVFGKTGIFNLARQIYVRFHLWLIVYTCFHFLCTFFIKQMPWLNRSQNDVTPLQVPGIWKRSFSTEVSYLAEPTWNKLLILLYQPGQLLWTLCCSQTACMLTIQPHVIF